MRVGYSVLNLSLEENPDSFKMVARSKPAILEAAERNLAHLEKVLRFNSEHGLFFYRIPPDLVPYASRRDCRVDWETRCAPALRRVAELLRAQDVRINVHPDLATMLNSDQPKVLAASLADLEYQAAMLDALGLDGSAKIQFHLGAPGSDVEAGLARFVEQCRGLDERVRRRLAIENDNVCCTLERCRRIHGELGLPVVFDVLHHELDHHGERVAEALGEAHATWGPADGPPMVDYSSQRPRSMPGRHAQSIDLEHFRGFLAKTAAFDFDLMLELKDRERSALAALEALAGDPRLRRTPRPG